MSKKFIASVLVSILFLSSCGKAAVPEVKTETPKKSVTTEVVKSDYFTERVKLVAKIAPSKETTVSAQAAGVIKTLNAAIGKNVKKGDILATLDFSTTASNVNLNNASNAYSNTLTTYGLTVESTQKDLENARIALENARTSKSNTYASTEKQLQLAQTQLDNILIQKNNTEKTTAISIDLATKSRDQAKLALANFEKTSAESLKSLQTKRTGLYSSARVSLDSALTSLDSALTQADLILGVTDQNRNANDGYETYLSAKNPALKTAAEDNFHAARFAYDTVLSRKDFSTPGMIDTQIPTIIELANATNLLYDSLVSVLDNSIVSSSFPQTTLDGLKATVNAKQSGVIQIQSTLVGLKNSMDDLANTISSTETTIMTTRTSLETGLSIAETSLQNAIAGTTSSLDGVSGTETLTRTQLENTITTVKSSRDSVDSAVKIAEAQYESTKAKLQSQLTGVKSQLDASKGQKDIAAIQVENGLIRAPFDGVILTKTVDLGALVNPGSPVFTIGDDSNLIIRTDVNPDIVGSLKIGQTVSVAKDTKMFTGTISLLAPGSDVTTRMFRMEAVFQDIPGSKEVFHIGDFADMFITRTTSDTKSITIPFSALISDGQGGFIVYTVGSGNIATKKAVKIGAQNESRVEILDGLSEGDKVVISGALNLQDGDGVVEN
ncbi:MAG: efflux RND transporter periplasmic adaptor subunit [Candidatus Gracilibacteria bacterium]|nr:efflux RND transporter periplasmic adaptor subunit [Candidatus Gracilibacteria bacterium]